MSRLKVGGLTRLTSIDYPGELAAVVYCQGCPWRCRYCHNPDLLSRQRGDGYDWDDVLAFLKQRRGLLDAVVFSGGEPTLQAGLADAIIEVRELGFKVGLHSAGCYPRRLVDVLPLVDWVGLDIKASPERYPATTGVAGSGKRAWRSLELLLSSSVRHEVRVTVHDALLPRGQLSRLLNRLVEAGTQLIVLQACRWHEALDGGIGRASCDWITTELLDQAANGQPAQLLVRP